MVRRVSPAATASIPHSALAYAELAAEFDARGRDVLAHLALIADVPLGDVQAVVAAGADRHVVGAHLLELGIALRGFRSSSSHSDAEVRELVRLKGLWRTLLSLSDRSP